jgi:hypothetical protein
MCCLGADVVVCGGEPVAAGGFGADVVVAGADDVTAVVVLTLPAFGDVPLPDRDEVVVELGCEPWSVKYSSVSLGSVPDSASVVASLTPTGSEGACVAVISELMSEFGGSVLSGFPHAAVTIRVHVKTTTMISFFI